MAVVIAKSGLRQGIQSFELGVGVFREVQRLGRPATLNEIARLSGMSSSKAHRYCVSLTRTGLLRQDKRGLYGIGIFGLQLAPPQSSLENAVSIALAEMPRFAREFGETVFLSGWGTAGPRIIHVVDADKPITIRPNTRDDLPLHNSATGRVFAAFMSTSRREELLEAEFEALRQRGQVSSNARAAWHRGLARQLADVRRRGLARMLGDRHPGLNSFAAPIFDHNGEVILTLTAFGLSATFPSSWEAPIAAALRAATTQLTRRIMAPASSGRRNA